MTVGPQQQLDELLKRFGDEHPRLSEQLSVLPTVQVSPVPSGFKVAVSTGTDTKPNRLAFLGSGTARSS